MSNVLEYKGYQASIEFSAEDGVLFGKILHIQSLILFEADSPAEIVSAFHRAVDDYLDYCREKGVEPNKTYSGTLNVRIGQERHRKIALHAAKNGSSLNDMICQVIDRFFSPNEEKNQQPAVFVIGQDKWEQIGFNKPNESITMSLMALEEGLRDERRH